MVAWGGGEVWDVSVLLFFFFHYYSVWVGWEVWLLIWLFGRV